MNGVQFRKWRNDRHISREKISYALNISQTTVIEWETKKKLPIWLPMFLNSNQCWVRLKAAGYNLRNWVIE